VYYAIIVSEQGNKRLPIKIDERRGVRFAINDDTGRAIVDPLNAQVAPAFDHEEIIGWHDRETPAQAAFLARHGANAEGFFSTKSLTFNEAVIEIGDQIAVVGAGSRTTDPAASGQSIAASTLHVTGSAVAPLSILGDSVQTVLEQEQQGRAAGRGEYPVPAARMVKKPR
jgi:hypothetical protein